MTTFKVQTLNNISPVGLDEMPRESYEVASKLNEPDVILLRSHNMHDSALPETLKAVGRAGVGVNNIPIPELTKKGVPVFNAPGANANAVKELVIAGMLLGCRNICQAWRYVKTLNAEDGQLNTLVEAGKKTYSGFELTGRTLGIIGLGAIGVKVANAAVSLGMKVIGFDPVITVKQAWQLEAGVKQAQTLDQLLSASDFVTIHVPLTEQTKEMINLRRLEVMKKGAVLLNFARAEIVDNNAVLESLDNDKLYAYINDFPSSGFLEHDRIISLPHLGASTKQSEDNSATMVVRNIKDYLENGNINCSVNFPETNMPWGQGFRVAIVNENIPNMVGQISTRLAESGLNVLDLINKSRDGIAYTLVDVDEPISDSTLEVLNNIEGVVSVRKIEGTPS